MMHPQTVDNYIIINQKYFPGDKILFLKERLYAMDEQRFSMLSTIELKDPVVILIISIFLGGLGIDRFMIGDIGLGVLKLLTFGVFGIFTIIDWFLISGRTKEKNFNQVMMFAY